MKFSTDPIRFQNAFVAPLAGAWIEIYLEIKKLFQSPVAPLAGAWIEINAHSFLRMPYPVAPLAGAWIEMSRVEELAQMFAVAPLAGAWIEIIEGTVIRSIGRSLPSRERGLKSKTQTKKKRKHRRSPRGSVD